MKRITSLFVCLLLFGFMALQAQDIQISGTVTSAEDGSPIPGVSVVVKGTKTGTATDINGQYQLTAPSDATLVFSSVGMKTVEMNVGGQSAINVVQETETIGLEEVVVTAIGITRTEKALGYAVTSVNPEEALKKSENDLLRSLEGKVPGVDIRSSSGMPGSSTRITIRGVSSFAGDNQPLFVVDGIPYSNDQYNTTSQSAGGGAYGSSLSTLDPNDIESINVLKGAAAGALYGSRAKNGVILIQTKTGNVKTGKKGMEVTVASSVNWEKISNLPEYQNTYGNGVDFAYSNANGSWGPRFDSRDSIPVWQQYKDVFPDMFSDSVAYVAQPNNVKDLFKTGIVYDNSVNISGGNDKSSFSLTASQLNNDGYVPFSSYKRTSIGVGGATNLTNGLIVSGNLSYSTSIQVGGIFGNVQADDENAASSFARTLFMGRTWDISLPYTDPVTGGPVNWNGNSQYDHPLWSWEHNKVTTDADRIVGKINLSYDITKWLNVAYSAGANTLIQRRKQIIDKYSRGYNGDGAIIDDDVWRQEIESNLLLKVDKTIGSDYNITAIIGHNVNQRTEDRQLVRGRQIINSGIYDIDNTNAVIPFGGQYYQRRLVGVFTDMTFAYKTYLFLNLAGRNDWSSTLPKNKNSYFYPSVSTSFIFSDAFAINPDILSLGKLRLSWGQVGMDADPYSISNIFMNKNEEDNVGSYKLNAFPFLGQPATTLPNNGNDPGLEPEKKSEFEIGTDLAVLKGRIRLDFTYYNNTSTNMIFNPQVAASSGYGSLWTNIGKLNNKGIEIGLNLVPIKTSSGFEWEIYTTFTKNKSEVKDIFAWKPDSGAVERTILSGLFGDPNIIIQVGQPYGVFYGNVSARDEEGNLLIDPGNGFMLLADEQEIYGDPNPDYKIGIINTFSYKGFSIRALIDYTHGGDVYSTTISSLLGRGVTKDTEDREHSFIIPGVYGDPNTKEPLLDGDGNKIQNITRLSMTDLYFSSGSVSSFAINAAGEWNVFDATVLRVREISVDYSIPEKLCSKTPFSSIQIGFTGRNLFFWAPNIPKYTNFDPEMNGYGSDNVQGVEYSVAPSVKRYGVNLKFTF